jgi:Cd2+/Zn2+-exporting ATPase
MSEPTLEAVTIDHAEKTIAMATLGQADVAHLEKRVSQAVSKGQEVSAKYHCGLLAGEGSCQSCDIPLTALEQERLTISRGASTTTIARVTCPTAPRFWRWIKFPWPRLIPRQLPVPEREEELSEWKWQLLAAALCGSTALIARLLEGTPASLPLFIFSYFAGGWFAAVEVWERFQKRTLDVHFLMLAVAAGSASIGAWGEGAVLLFLFSLSGALEHFAMGRTQREIRSLFRSAPKTATLLESDAHEHEVPVEQLQPGHRLLIRPGAQFPVDAEIIKGQTAADESNLTGESAPVEKKVGDIVLAGTLNLWGAIEALVLRPVQQSALQKIIHLIREAQNLKAPSQRLTDRFGTGYTYAILGVTLAMFFVWWLGFGLAPFRGGGEHSSAFYRAMTLLVVASPCALVLSIPSAILAAIAWGARRGVLFRGGAAVEKLAEVQVVALDKTGTLTTGELEVDRVETFPPGREDELARIAYSIERLSQHPLARAITRDGKRRKLEPLPLVNFNSVTGKGVEAEYEGKRCRVGRRDWLAEQSKADTGVASGEPGLSEVWVAWGDLMGRLILRDDIRPQARTVLNGLRLAGLKTVVLTGDRRATAERLEKLLGLDDVRAELHPEDKVQIIRGFTEKGERVAMVGDGVNDAPSLAAAHVGVAMGARGSDAALEQAEVILMHDRLENFLAAYQLSQRARRIIRENLFLSLGTVVMLVAFAMTGSLPLTLGVLGHEGSTVIVVINSLRLLFGGNTPNTTSGNSA